MPGLIEVAQSLIGVPFRLRGRGRDGLDCWGLVRLIYAEAYGIHLDEHGDIDGSKANAAHSAAVVEQERAGWAQVPAGEERQGDVVLLRHRGRPLHVGVVLWRGRMIHADEPHVRVEPYDGIVWGKRVLGLYRHPLLAAALPPPPG